MQDRQHSFRLSSLDLEDQQKLTKLTADHHKVIANDWRPNDKPRCPKMPRVVIMHRILPKVAINQLIKDHLGEKLRWTIKVTPVRKSPQLGDRNTEDATHLGEAQTTPSSDESPDGAFNALIGPEYARGPTIHLFRGKATPPS